MKEGATLVVAIKSDALRASDALDAAFRLDPDKIILVGRKPALERRARRAGYEVEVVTSEAGLPPGARMIQMDPTAAARAARFKKRLIAGGGKRMAINLDGRLVKKLDRLVKAGLGDDHSSVIRALIENA